MTVVEEKCNLLFIGKSSMLNNLYFCVLFKMNESANGYQQSMVSIAWCDKLRISVTYLKQLFPVPWSRKCLKSRKQGGK